MTRGSRGYNQAGRAGGHLRVKVNLLIFKDEKTKDTVMYHSWWWDIAIFCPLGWHDQHLLLYIFWSLQGFPGDLARNLGEDATLANILQMLDEHYGVVMMFDTQGTLFSQTRIQVECGWVQSTLVTTGSDTPVGVSRKDSRRACGGDEMRLFLPGPETPNTGTCWPTKWMANTLLITPTCSLQHGI